MATKKNVICEIDITIPELGMASTITVYGEYQAGDKGDRDHPPEQAGPVVTDADMDGNAITTRKFLDYLQHYVNTEI